MQSIHFLKKIIVILILIILVSPTTYSKEPKRRVYFEKDYQKYWCDKNCGTTEVISPDKARVDCVTDTHAIEFDFANKWAESIGQAIYYSVELEKKAGVVLIVEDKIKDQRYINRLLKANQKLNMDIWYIYPEDIPKKSNTNKD